MINQYTKLYISASKQPGRFGASIFNELFRLNSINALYLPRKFESAEDLVSSLRNMKIQGCGVSNPLKISVIAHLDKLDDQAIKLHSVNTICQKDRCLIGYNTDWSGAKTALEEKLKRIAQRPLSARILGSGGVCSALIFALQSLGIEDIEIVYRNRESATKLKVKWGVSLSAIEADSFGEKDLLINAIPEVPQSQAGAIKFATFSQLIFDLTVSPSDTPLIKFALSQKKEVIRGYEMAKYQLIEQYYIYQNERISDSVVTNLIQTCYLGKTDV